MRVAAIFLPILEFQAISCMSWWTFWKHSWFWSLHFSHLQSPSALQMGLTRELQTETKGPTPLKNTSKHGEKTSTLPQLGTPSPSATACSPKKWAWNNSCIMEKSHGHRLATAKFSWCLQRTVCEMTKKKFWWKEESSSLSLFRKEEYFVQSAYLTSAKLSKRELEKWFLHIL